METKPEPERESVLGPEWHTDYGRRILKGVLLTLGYTLEWENADLPYGADEAYSLARRSAG